MRKVAIVLVLSLAVAGAASATEPTLSAGGGGMNVLDTPRVVIWSEPPDLDGLIASSEIIGDLGLETEIANDFVLSYGTLGVLAWWWGGYYNGNGCGDIGFGARWNLRLYDDGGCVPSTLLSEVIATDAHERFIHCQNGTYPIFEYWANADCVPVLANTLYWFSAQASSHPFPPQVGRLASGGVVNCTSVFRSPYFGFPNWVSALDVFGVDVDFSQEFEPCIGTPVQQTTWGSVKALYR